MSTINLTPWAKLSARATKTQTQASVRFVTMTTDASGALEGSGWRVEYTTPPGQRLWFVGELPVIKVDGVWYFQAPSGSILHLHFGVLGLGVMA